MKINREVLLRAIKAVEPGLSQREIIEQSTCLVFLGGRVLTYNDEVSCSNLSPLNGEVRGAVPARKLISVLEKMPEEEIDVKTSPGGMVILGKARRATFRLEKEVFLPVDAVETPTDWLPLHPDFCEAIGVVSQCASRDQSSFYITCVHIHPQWVEGFDNYQACRWSLPTGLDHPVLVQQTAINHITQVGMTEFSETQNWLHFRNPSDLIISCRKIGDTSEYPELTDANYLVVGTSAALPKGLVQTTSIAEEFSGEYKDNNFVKLRLKAGGLKLEATGASGKYEELKKLRYDGPEISFLIPPKLLADLVQRCDECTVTSQRLGIDGGKYKYVTALYQEGEMVAKEEAEEEIQA